jgi:hypothetical protein
MQEKDLSKKKMRWNYFYDDKVSITKIVERYELNELRGYKKIFCRCGWG